MIHAQRLAVDDESFVKERAVTVHLRHAHVAVPVGHRARRLVRRIPVAGEDGLVQADQTVCRRYHHRNAAGGLVSRQVGVDIRADRGIAARVDVHVDARVIKAGPEQCGP